MSFNVIIDSLKRQGTDGNAVYSMDWSFLADDAEYDLTFSYRTTEPISAISRQSPGTYNGGELYLSLPDLPNNNYEIVSNTNSNYGRAVSSSIVGILTFGSTYSNGDVDVNDGDYITFHTPHTFNPPTRVKKPMVNDFRVHIYAKNVGNAGYDDPTERILMDDYAQDYILILNFKKV